MSMAKHGGRRATGLGCRRALGLVCLAVLIGAGCAADAPAIPLGPDGQPDVELVAGKAVWETSCARCHGASGQGGFGPRLSGRVQQRLTDAEQIEVIVGGRKAMPSFGDRLTEAQIEAVVRFTREVL